MLLPSTALDRKVGRGLSEDDRQTIIHFSWIAASFLIIYLFSWREVFSLNLWVLKDRGSFLNLDYLQAQHLRLGVDTFYSYGLLPVALQHVLFLWFGRGYWSMLGCAMVTLLLVAVFCALLLRVLPRGWIWFVAVLALSRIMNLVVPNLPYEPVQLSLMYGILFVLYRRLDLALAVSAIGCWSVPSLSLAMAGMLAALLLGQWFLKRQEPILCLLRSYIPGVVTYLATGAFLRWEFGWPSVAATATPMAGMRFYKQVGFGTPLAFMEFLHPPGFGLIHEVVYIFACPVVWWVFSMLCLLAFTFHACRRVWMSKKLEGRDTAIFLCASIEVLLAVVAYGSRHQHYIFDPLLISGMLLGLSTMQPGQRRNVLMSIFVLLGVMGQAALLRTDILSWEMQKSPGITAGLYADSEWIREWSPILNLSKRENVLLLSYGTGAHHYFPTVHSPELWTLQVGQLLPADEDRMLRQIDAAQVVVLDRSSPVYAYADGRVQQRLSHFNRTSLTEYFEVWQRTP
ncbi:hypothetical protein ACFPT7_06285 [Acidicapsa dinghuensis]|uniref:Glycosyltransferase RgtA/B/C/D-like domain-containing protein n=1 Tax=Acidicapsa dinghuensis TaxID=2218256 RepID=A0ABW1ED25_9BACT|nr:hypothetical protein [Acidicapsa dinghuensis]